MALSKHGIGLSLNCVGNSIKIWDYNPNKDSSDMRRMGCLDQASQVGSMNRNSPTQSKIGFWTRKNFIT
jgi:hypothetical protein